MTLPIVSGAGQTAKEPIMARANPVSAAPTVTTMQRQAATGDVAAPPALQPASDDTTLPIVSGVGQTAKEPIMARANPISAAPTVATIQRQAATGDVAAPPALQSARDDTTLPVVSGAGQTTDDASSRATVRLDATTFTHQPTSMLARTASAWDERTCSTWINGPGQAKSTAGLTHGGTQRTATWQP